MRGLSWFFQTAFDCYNFCLFRGSNLDAISTNRNAQSLNDADYRFVANYGLYTFDGDERFLRDGSWKVDTRTTRSPVAGGVSEWTLIDVNQGRQVCRWRRARIQRTKLVASHD